MGAAPLRVESPPLQLDGAPFNGLPAISQVLQMKTGRQTQKPKIDCLILGSTSKIKSEIKLGFTARKFNVRR